ncbi:MAG: hypothetical protein HOV79_05590 [Hamadaea sp.]|nr:hypothetical protein [Hamadaea sp.]
MRKRTLLYAGTAAWAVLLVGLGYYSYRTGPATVPGQTTAAEARATMDRVTGELTAVSSSVRIGEYAEKPCEITNARDGVALRRELTFTTAPGDEATLVRSLAAGLPPAYQAVSSGSAETPTLYADAGTFVAVRGRKGDPGTVLVTLISGCRTP